MPNDHVSQAPEAESTTTGRTSKASPLESTAPQADAIQSGLPQPGSDPVRPVNPDTHGQAGKTQPTEASRLEEEAVTSEENRY